MGNGDWLASGEYGVEAALPESFEPVEDGIDALRYDDLALGVSWAFFFFPGRGFDLRQEHQAALTTLLEGPARCMFEAVHLTLATDPTDEPRTSDPTWSPMIDVEFVTTPTDAPALRTIHRMVYRQGMEVVMGHLLVPLTDGLFEARAWANNGNGSTGLRESVVLLEERPDDDLQGDSRERQRLFDAPKHDERFPAHPLSRVRKALDDLTTESGLQVSDPAQPQQDVRVNFEDPTCSLIPPRGFQTDDEGLVRVAFCGTDGIQHFIVDRLKNGKDLVSIATTDAIRILDEAGVEDIETSVVTAALEPDREIVLVAVDGTGTAGPLQSTMAYFRAANSIWSLAITTTRHIDSSLIASELVAAAKTLEAPAARKRLFGLF